MISSVQTPRPGQLRDEQSLDSAATHRRVGIRSALALLVGRDCRPSVTTAGCRPRECGLLATQLQSVACFPRWLHAASEHCAPCTSSFSPRLRAALLVPNFLHLLPLLLCLIYHHCPCFCKLIRYKSYDVSCAMVSVIPPESWKMEKHRLKTTKRFCLPVTSQGMLPTQPCCLSELTACIASLPLRACCLHSLGLQF